MKDLLKIALDGAFTNFKRIFFAADRVTDMELRNQIATGNVVQEETLDVDACIGCGGCANVCPTGAIDMKALATPVTLTDEWVKTEIPEIDSLKCIVCYYCHDFCPVYALFGLKGTIHPNSVGEQHIEVSDLLNMPVKISEDKLKVISKYLSDKTIVKNKKE